MTRGKIYRMPNQPRTPQHTVRVTDELWYAAKEAAAAEGETLSDVIREALVQLVRRHARKAKHAKRMEGK